MVEISDEGSHPGLEEFLAGGMGNLLQYSCKIQYSGVWWPQYMVSQRYTRLSTHMNMLKFQKKKSDITFSDLNKMFIELI